MNAVLLLFAIPAAIAAISLGQWVRHELATLRVIAFLERGGPKLHNESD